MLAWSKRKDISSPSKSSFVNMVNYMISITVAVLCLFCPLYFRTLRHHPQLQPLRRAAPPEILAIGYPAAPTLRAAHPRPQNCYLLLYCALSNWPHPGPAGRRESDDAHLRCRTRCSIKAAARAAGNYCTSGGTTGRTSARGGVYALPG